MTDSLLGSSHREWRRMVKKMRRKRIRQCLAEARKKEEKARENSPKFLTELAKKRLLEEYELERIENERKERYEKWLRDEEEAQRVWREQQRLQELAKEERMRELERIREEWKEEQKKIQEKRAEIERLKKEEEERKQITLKKINDFIENGGEVPAELKVIRESNPGKEICSFFSKVGACRFGPQCSRNHQHPGISKVLLFTNFYSHFTLDQNHSSEYDTDIGLEFEDSDMYLHFVEFYNDVVPELKSNGIVKMIKICCNTEFHLRGNVYVEYNTLREALVSYNKFQGRWYGGKQLHLEFINISDWGSAVCGDFARNRCPKGKSCNFLHVFKNPKNEFPIEWNRSKNVNSFNDSVCEHSRSPSRDRHFRWSETPEPCLSRRRMKIHKEKKNRHKSASRDRESDYNNKRPHRNRKSSDRLRSSRSVKHKKSSKRN